MNSFSNNTHTSPSQFKDTSIFTSPQTTSSKNKADIRKSVILTNNILKLSQKHSFDGKDLNFTKSPNITSPFAMSCQIPRPDNGTPKSNTLFFKNKRTFNLSSSVEKLEPYFSQEQSTKWKLPHKKKELFDKNSNSSMTNLTQTSGTKKLKIILSSQSSLKNLTSSTTQYKPFIYQTISPSTPNKAFVKDSTQERDRPPTKKRGKCSEEAGKAFSMSAKINKARAIAFASQELEASYKEAQAVINSKIRDSIEKFNGKSQSTSQGRDSKNSHISISPIVSINSSFNADLTSSDHQYVSRGNSLNASTPTSKREIVDFEQVIATRINEINWKENENDCLYALKKKLTIVSKTFSEVIKGDRSHAASLQAIKKTYDKYIRELFSIQDAKLKKQEEDLFEFTREEISNNEKRLEEELQCERKRREEAEKENTELKEEISRLTEGFHVKDSKIDELEKAIEDFIVKEGSYKTKLRKLEIQMASEKERHIAQSNQQDEILAKQKAEIGELEKREEKYQNLLSTLEERGYPIREMYEAETKDSSLIHLAHQNSGEIFTNLSPGRNMKDFGENCVLNLIEDVKNSEKGYYTHQFTGSFCHEWDLSEQSKISKKDSDTLRPMFASSRTNNTVSSNEDNSIEFTLNRRSLHIPSKSKKDELYPLIS